MRSVVKNSDHPYVMAQNALRDKWRCTKCGTTAICFIQPHPESTRPDVHVEMTPTCIDLWAGEIKAGKATIYQPPRNIPEINMRCNAAILRPAGRGRPVESSAAAESSTAARSGYAPIINYNIQPPSPSDRATISLRPRTPPAVERHYQAVSPIPGYAPKDYADDALKAYMVYLLENWGNARTPYLELYKALQNKDVGVDQLNSPGMEQTLREEFDCTIGMASRIVSEYPVWKRSLKGVRSIHILILQC
jgi:hypothetical protein